MLSTVIYALGAIACTIRTCTAGDRSLTAAAPSPAPTTLYDQFGCQTFNFTQSLDHFSTANSNQTFNQTYVVCNAAFPTTPEVQAAQGTIIFFLGNEGPLGTPQQPIVFENAARMHALVIELEHRYYGSSLPCVPDNVTGLPTTEQLQFLSVEQVMEDSKTVLQAVRLQYNISTQVPVVVIGGR